MARSPRSSVPKTSGQGVSRLSYQKGYDLGNRGGGSDFKGSGLDKSRDRYAKSSKGDSQGINVSYGDTYFGTDEMQDLINAKSPKSQIKNTRKRKEIK